MQSRAKLLNTRPLGATGSVAYIQLHDESPDLTSMFMFGRNAIDKTSGGDRTRIQFWGTGNFDGNI